MAAIISSCFRRPTSCANYSSVAYLYCTTWSHSARAWSLSSINVETCAWSYLMSISLWSSWGGGGSGGTSWSLKGGCWSLGASLCWSLGPSLYPSLFPRCFGGGLSPRLPLSLSLSPSPHPPHPRPHPTIWPQGLYRSKIILGTFNLMCGLNQSIYTYVVPSCTCPWSYGHSLETNCLNESTASSAGIDWTHVVSLMVQPKIVAYWSSSLS